MMFKRFSCIYICCILAACASNQKRPDLSTLTCEQHLSFAQKANQFGGRNFDNTYSNDPQGAEAQLFLIKEKAPTNFAVNYNAAEADFNRHLKIATEKGCNTSEYPVSPIREFENKLNALKAFSSK